MDIRSYFKPTTSTSHKPEAKQKKKRPLIVDSSDDDVVDATPDKPSNRDKKPIKRQKVTLSSDSDEDLSKKRKQKPKTPSKVNAADVFGSTPVKQTKAEKVNSKEKSKSDSKLTETGIHNDPDFEKTLLELDEDLLIENADILDKTIEEALEKDSKKKKTPNKKRKKSKEEDEDTGIDPDQERHERKRYSAILYQKYLNRSGPIHHGEKEYPNGTANCLKNLCFVRTGVLDSLAESEFASLVEKHGGRTVNSISKKVNYLVVGDQAGPSKTEKARNYNIPFLNENEFLDLILVKSGMKPKYAVKEEINSDKDDEPEIIGEIKKKSPEIKEVKKENKDDLKVKKEIVEKKNDVPKEIVEKKNDVIPKGIKKENKLPENKKIVQEIKESAKEIKIEGSIIDDETKAWTEKYKPSNIKGIIGQQGDKSNMKKLLSWLQNWDKYHGVGKRKIKVDRPTPSFSQQDGSYFKCALLSGPPGVGKTTTATLVCKELGYDIVEFNASDTRSKKLLHEEVSQLLSTTSLAGYFKNGLAPTKKHVLLMDEVDGMAGNEDRGGIQELISLIKNTNIPIICMCNDRNHPKIRSLVMYCFDLRFTKPRLEQIRGAMMSICFKENIKITPQAITEIITATEMDIRQTLNNLFMWTTNNKSDKAENSAKTAKKDLVLGPWEVIRKVFSEEDHKTMSLSDKSRLFFYDYSIGPLFVHENYLHVVPHCPKGKFLENFAKTADSISMGDIIDKKIRSGNNWSLLSIQAIFSSVLPGHYLEGHFGGQINFPGWLGKNSARSKHRRLITELQSHMRTSISGSRNDVNLDYSYFIRNKIIKPLIKNGNEGVNDSVAVMNTYNLLREDLSNLIHVTSWSKQSDPMAMVDSKVKAAFTRAYNKNVLLPYASATTVKKKASSYLEEDNLNSENDENLSDGDEEDVSKDSMVTAKKAKKPVKGGEKKPAEKKPGRGRGKKK
ncbi:replication factor C subunit 1 [Onthophagus taurus]|uniref:replication factor C subunit 1 n=1 Tax=Onthophagus taurus TaxID=166361 RepID=UPI0039BE13A5